MENTSLDTESLGPTGRAFVVFAQKRMKGQDKAILRLAKALDHAASPLRVKDKPIYSVLLVGGAGSGKTHLAQVLAEFWFHDPDGCIFIPCSEFSNMTFSQETLWHSDYLEQRRVGPHREMLLKRETFLKERNALAESIQVMESHLEGMEDGPEMDKIKGELSEKKERFLKLSEELEALNQEILPIFNGLRSIVVLDHIENAKPMMHEAFHVMLEHGVQTFYGQEGARKVSLANTIIFLTCSDLVSDEAGAEKGDKTVGFIKDTDREKKAARKLTGTDELKEYISPKLLSRIVRIEFLREYGEAVKNEIVTLFSNALSDSLEETYSLTLVTGEDVKRFLSDEASDHPEMGIRLLRHKFDKYVTWPLENLIGQSKVHKGDTIELRMVSVEKNKRKVEFTRKNV